MRKANENDYKNINQYFKEIGQSYDDKEILVTNSPVILMEYIFKTEYHFIIELMRRINTIQEGDSMLESLIEEIPFVWHNCENRLYYVIVQ